MKKIEIPLQNLLVALVKRWWLILLCASIGAGLMYIKADRADQANQAAYRQEAAEFEGKLAAHNQKVEAQKSYASYLAGLRDVHVSLSHQADERVGKSLLMKLDLMRLEAAYLLAEAEGEQGDRAVDLAVLDSETLSLREALGDAYPEGVEEWALKELLTVRREGSLLYIACLQPKDAGVDAGLVVEKVFAALAQRVSGDAVRPGSLSALRKGAGPVDSAPFYKLKKEVADEARAARDRMNDLIGWTGNQERSLAELVASAPVSPQEPAPQAGKSAVQGAVLGAVLGAFLTVALYFILLPLQEKRQLRRLLGVPFFGALTEKDGYALCLANAQTAAQGKKELLLTGSRISRADAEKIAQKLNGMQQDIRFTAGENVERSADTVRQLAGADGVVLLERVNASNLRAVYSQMERLEQSKAQVLGYCVY